jgi:signal transduction histidine kinase
MTLALLIVDDDQAERILTERLAQETFPGARIEAVGDALAAREICKTQAFDCVILDYNMPGMDGMACAQRLRAALPWLPIVMSTGYGDEMLAAHAVTSGVTDYIPKSRINTQSLCRVVENAIRVTQQARLIDEQRSELENFAFALAHDFKQPIRQIATFANLVSEAVQEGRTDDIGRHLSFLTGAAQRLGNLVDVMAQYTLLSQPPAMTAVDLNLVFENVRRSLEPYIVERGGQVRYGKAPPVCGNEALVSQVIQNLIVNGLKYNAAATPSVDISSESADGHCTIRVRDNGIGIAPQYAEEIFKPLMRLHTKTEYSGTGLGLTLARKALAAMDGTILCQSQPGAGTTFIVRLALAAGAS